MRELLSILLAALLLAAPTTACAVEAPDDTDLVTDAFSYQAVGDYNSFALPRIDREGEGIQAVNDAIWRELYEEELYSEYGAMTAIEEGWSPEPYNMTYDWAVNGDLLSLWTVSSYSNDYNVYFVYNVSLSAGRRITDGELLDVLELDPDDFYGQAALVLSDTFEKQSSMSPEDEFKAQQRQANNDPANVRAVRPYLDGNGDLCVIGRICAMAGAGEYAQPLTVMTADRLPAAISSASLPETLSAEERLACFIERCDSEFFAPADIAGFDEQMCVYAINGAYARAGRIFADPALEEYFSRFVWYRPSIEPDQFTDDLLGPYQLANIRLVLDYQAGQGF